MGVALVAQVTVGLGDCKRVAVAGIVHVFAVLAGYVHSAFFPSSLDGLYPSLFLMDALAAVCEVRVDVLFIKVG